jgi:hypothetical protein
VFDGKHAVDRSLQDAKTGKAAVAALRGRILTAVARAPPASGARFDATAVATVCRGRRGGLRSAAKSAAPWGDGGFYVACEDAASPVRVQRLDAAGRELWAHDGVATARAGNFTDLTIDADGNAAIALLAGSAPAYVKVAPDGGFPWGAGGPILSDSATSTVLAAATGDGGLVGLWNEGRGFRLQKLDAAGDAQWDGRGPAGPPAADRPPRADRRARHPDAPGASGFRGPGQDAALNRRRARAGLVRACPVGSPVTDGSFRGHRQRRARRR